MGFLRLRLALIVALSIPCAAWATRDVTVVVDMSPQGRKLVRPTPAQPVYYFPTMRGYQRAGEGDTSQTPPSPHLLAHLVAEELAQQGYLAASTAHPSPSLVIDIAWGYINPVVDYDNGIAWNQSEMYALVLGHTARDVIPYESNNREQLILATKQNRFFIILTAYDFATYAKTKERLMLWVAKISVPSDGLYFDDVATPLLKAGGPLFGIESDGKPRLFSIVPDGHVIVGTPTVKPDSAPSVATPAK